MYVHPVLRLVLLAMTYLFYVHNRLVLPYKGGIVFWITHPFSARNGKARLFGYDLHFLPRVVRGDGDCGWGLLREAKLQGGAG